MLRPTLAALVLGAVLATPVRAVDLRNFGDAALHAVQFVDANEGWAVGDEGVIWHTFDGGKHWERQPTGTRATLRALHFLNPYTGWVVGREELPNGAGSSGLLLFTSDGGLHWRKVGTNHFPGLNAVRFLDLKNGYVAGDGSDQFPASLFVTSDAGRSWQPVIGPRSPGWLAADFRDGKTGLLAGAWGRLWTVRQGGLAAADIEPLGSRAVRSVRVAPEHAVAVGQGGLVLLSPDAAGSRWSYARLNLPPAVQSAWDLHGVAVAGDHVWAAGRPGAVVLHSPDRGATWQVQSTGQPLPLNGLFFLDDRQGWAVGEFGSILGTSDGGATWRVQRRGGQRAAVLFVHAQGSGVPLDTVARLGGEEGYLTAALCVTTPDPATAPPLRASEAQRFATAVRQVGGGAGEVLWQFPLAEHLADLDRQGLVRAWDEAHNGRATEQLVRQLVLALRVWRPDVVVTDEPEARAVGTAAEALLAEAVREACSRASDPNLFPEQLKVLGLEPWHVSKVYGRWSSRTGAHVVQDLTEVSYALESTVRDFAAPAAGLLGDGLATLPTQRHYRLLASRLEGATAHKDLMQGITLAPGGEARRVLAALGKPDPEIEQAIRTRRNLQALAEAPGGGLVDPNKVLALAGPELARLPDEQAAPAAFAIANQYVRLGQWTLARELFLLMVDRYPSHPLSADAYRWLVRHNSSSEARRRHELGQFLVSTQSMPQQAREPTPKDGPIAHGGSEVQHVKQLALLGNREETRRWYQGSLDVGKRLAAYGLLFATDPSVQFCLQSAHRNLGDFETARDWYSRYCTEHRDGPWHAAAAAELWLLNRTGESAKPVSYCRQASSRPFLDGNFDDACWQGLKPMLLRPAAGEALRDYATEARLAYDKDFLYLALRCRHPAARHVPPVKTRERDADLRAHDRVSILFDLDRDYATCFHLQVDQRGCVHDDCWGDRTWNPRWFVAVKSEPEGWQVEAAIPLMELTGDQVTPGRAWACNVVRVLPGRGVQAWSQPADVQPRPEGMGLLLFTPDGPARKEQPRAAAQP